MRRFNVNYQSLYHISSRRSAIRTRCFLVLFALLAAVYLPLGELNAAKYERMRRESLLRGIDILTEAMCEMAKGDSSSGPLRSADTALSLLPLDKETAASLTRFLNCAAEMPPDSPNRHIIVENAERLYGQLRVISDSVASSSLGMTELVRLTSILRIDVELPDYSFSAPTSDTAADKKAVPTRASSEGEITEGEARDIAANIIGRNAPLRLSDAATPEVWSFCCSNAYIDISKSGGRLVRYSLSVEPKPAKLATSDALSVIDRFMLSYCQDPFELVDAYEGAGLLWAIYSTEGGSVAVAVTLDCGKVCFYEAVRSDGQ